MHSSQNDNPSDERRPVARRRSTVRPPGAGGGRAGESPPGVEAQSDRPAAGSIAAILAGALMASVGVGLLFLLLF